MKRADASPPIHDLLAERWSPRAFDPNDSMEGAAIDTLLEAARWAPSASNTQPWRFLIGIRGDSTFAEIVKSLKPGNAKWAPNAAVLILALAKHVKEDQSPLPHAAYDTGQAVAHLTIQAQALGLSTHQMAGFDSKIADTLGVPEIYKPMTVIAIGRTGDADQLLEEDLLAREKTPRQRRARDQIAIQGRWSKSLED
jgi:nitroreductase